MDDATRGLAPAGAPRATRTTASWARIARSRAALGARSGPSWRALAGVSTGLALLAVIGVPLLRLAAVALENGAAGLADATAAGSVTAVVNTIWLAAAVTALSVAAGTALALATERSVLPGRTWLRPLILLPLLLPPFVTAQAFADAYGPFGVLDQALGIGVPAVYGPAGVALVLALGETPLVYLLVAAALASRADRAAELAARVSGACARDTLWSVTLPLLRPTLAASAALVFLSSINAFGVPAVLGTPGGFTTVTTRLYSDLAFSSDPAVFRRVVSLATLLVIAAVAGVALADAATGRLAPAARTSEADVMYGPPARGRRASTVVLATAVGLAAVVPLFALVLTALTRAAGLAPMPPNWTLDNFRAALAGPAIPAIATSLLLAALAATGVVLLGALAVAGGRSRAGRLISPAIAAGYVVPGSALAIAVLLAYGGSLRDSLAIILVAYLVKFWAIGQRSIQGTAGRLAPELGHAVRASGGGRASIVRLVLVPGLGPTIAAAWFLVFVLALHELTMSSLLYGPGTATLAVVVLNLQQLGDPGVSAALAVVLTLLVLAAAAPLLLVRRVGSHLLVAR